MFLKTCGLFRRLFILFFKQKLFGIRDAHWIASTSNGEFFRVLSVVVGWSGGSFFRVDHFFFKLFLPFAIFLLRLSSPGKLLQVCVYFYFSAFLSAMRPRGCAKNLLVEFSENNYRENKGFLGRFLFPDSLFFYSTPICHFLEPCCSETAFAKQRLASVDF